MLLRLSGIVKPLTIIIKISGLLLSQEATLGDLFIPIANKFLYMVPTFMSKSWVWDFLKS